jgi:hypothetical protein
MRRPKFPLSDDYFIELKDILNRQKSRRQLYQSIVDAPFQGKNKFNSTLLGLGFLAFLQVNESSRTLDRITISDTPSALGAINMTMKAFNDMKVPLNHKGNIILTAIRTGAHQQTTNWHYLTDPAVTEVESRMNQAAAGMASSVVYPIMETKPKGAIIFQYFINMDEITSAHHNFMFRYIKIVSSALNSIN